MAAGPDAAFPLLAVDGASSSSVPWHSLTADFFFLNSHISAGAYQGRASCFPLSAVRCGHLGQEREGIRDMSR